ncbi:MAG: hypothetical protein DMF72_12300 [Acidobacteria bacterium]|nr:MAG: hypothetical protein DMF72_12300 [Acidobacteriota bacterium]
MPPGFQLPHSSTRHCALPQNKQGIGIIFIERFFATCFACCVGPIVIMITFPFQSYMKKFFLFRNTCRQKRLRRIAVCAID